MSIFAANVLTQSTARAQTAPPATPPILERFSAAGTPQNTVRFTADRQERLGAIMHLRGNAEVMFGDMRLTAEEVDYDEYTRSVDARGQVHFSRQSTQEDIQADDAHYNLDTELGQFYRVRGSIGAPARGRQALLTTTNPYYFEAARIDRIGDNTYVIYDGFVTSCRPAMPIWTFSSERAVIKPGDRAYIHNAVVKFGNRVPVFYLPILYHSLRKLPRASGFLTPHIGNSSNKGKVAGGAFYWAINRSADAQAGLEYYSARGWAQTGSLRTSPRAGTSLTAAYFGVVDRGLSVGGNQVNQGGRTIFVNGSSDLPHGFRAVANFNYLSSFTFRLAFTETFLEAVNSEVHSIVFVSNNFRGYSFNGNLSRFENFQFFPGRVSGEPVDIRNAPSLEFNGYDQPLFKLKVDGRDLPLYFSFDSAAEVLSRSEPLLATPSPPGQVRVVTGFIGRFELAPRLSLPLHWRGLHLLPSYEVRATHYGSRFEDGRVVGDPLARLTRQFTLEMRPPSLERIFNSPSKLFGEKLKHVVEPRAAFRQVNGVEDFSQILHFDERDLVANTRELEYGVTNRFFSKRSDGLVREIFAWDLRQQYYFDPTFGGALVPGRRNVFASTLGLTGYAFLDGERHFSPVVSTIRLFPAWNLNGELRNDYDPVRQRVVNSGFTFNARHNNLFASLSDFFVNSSPTLQPRSSNQIRTQVGYGNGNRRGFNVATTFVYDLRETLLPYTAVQANYNFDCCGFSVEYRRFHFGATLRDENSFRVAISFANIGTFGNLKKQERIF